ncbi:MAG: AAA family ATPase [Rhodobacter sp.]|nr:AAA family ATPase [Rhodobacter sp.]
MRLREVTIKNFKAIDNTTLTLGDFNVIVGTNGSGKSSVLQALHWMFQSGRNRSVEANRDKNKGATLSENDATFMPTPDYRNAGHGHEYGNKQGTPQLDLTVKAESEDGAQLLAQMWIKSARNEGITVHVPSANAFVTQVRDQSREFSAYIPGLAGIPLTEEKRSKLIVQRLAAAGDANTVLRNVLDLLRQTKVEEKEGLLIVQEYVSSVMGKFSVEVDFEDDKHTRILARFQTAEMKTADPKRYKPLELAGIGFLQVIQIFAYLVYFRPVLLLVDEPDAHLHPMAQERLVSVLAEAASRFGTQVIMTTHSPSVVRALPLAARVLWMKDGKVQRKGDAEVRSLMGWGLLDRRVLLLTEDSSTEMLRELLAQWPDLERITAIWPFHGAAKLPAAETIKGLHHLLGDSLKIVIHRDRDFMMPAEVEVISNPYKDMGFDLWFTQCSDIEAY